MMITRHRARIATLALATFFALSSFAQSDNQNEARDHAKGNYVTILGKKIWYDRAGNGQPLLLIAGAGGSHDYLRPYFAPLESSFELIYFDGYGRGNSDQAKSPAEYTFDHDLDEIEALRQTLHLGKIMVYGHSYGGYVAQGYALKYPDSVSKLIISNIFVNGEDFQASDDHMNGEIQQFFPELWDKISQVRSQGLPSSSPEMQQLTGPYLLPILEHLYFYDPRNAAKFAPYFNAHNFSAEQWNEVAGPDADFNVGGDLRGLDFRSQLSSIKAPVLVIAGRHDGIVLPRLTVKFKTYAPQAQFVMFEHSGHYPFIEEPELFLNILKGFLK